jgi:hypothetical protein
MRNLGADSNGKQESAEQSGRLAGGEDGLGLTLAIGDELVERIAKRAAELVASRQEEAANGEWLRGAGRIAAYIDSPRSRVYALVSARRIPVHHDGSALIARRSELDVWLLAGGAKRP